MIGRLACLLMVCLAVPAAAQINGSASGYSDAPREASEAEYWSFVERLGFCLAETKTEEAVAFLATPIDSQAETAAFDALFHRSRNSCMRNFVNASVRRAYVRGAVAEGLFELMPAQDHDRLFSASLSGPAEIGTLHLFAQCYVAAHPEEAAGLLMQTRLATEGELQYVTQMAADFGDCLPRREIQLDSVNVRMALAEALLHAAQGLAVQPIQGSN